jgi:Glycosyl hydrolases family 2, TIM barrel domain/Glycosyl hydrolases family 2/Glycosyl hydrolases family 2, sugar binding domain
MSDVARRLLILAALCGLVLGIVLSTSPGSTKARADRQASYRPLTPPSGRGPALGPTMGPPTLLPPAAVALTRNWRARADPRDVGVVDGWGQGGAPPGGWSPVSIPNDFNPDVTKSEDRGRVVWYRVDFTGPPVASGRGWQVSFESVRRNASVWLNGRWLGDNHDPYVPFSLPATSLEPGRRNTLIVRVDNNRGLGSFPEDWWNWGGITGPVTLQPTGRVTIRNLAVLPELSCGYTCGDFRVAGTVANRSPGNLRAAIVVRVASPSGVTWTVTHQLPRLGRQGAIAVSFPVNVGPPLALWSPSSPSLYRVSVQMVAGGRVEEEHTLRVGLRSVEVHGGILFLNGERLWLHGAAIHEDVDGGGAAMTDGDVQTIVSELRSVGANITRAHYLLSPRLLDALDAAGIMVWAQPPVDHADAELASAGGRARALAMLRSTVLVDRNHPSVVVDSVANEVTPTPDSSPSAQAYLTAAGNLARALNPRVPVGLDIFCYPDFPPQRTYKQFDVIGISHYYGWYPGRPGHSIADFAGLVPFLELQHTLYPNQALAISEFGAESLYSGQATIKGSYEFQADYLRRTFAALDGLPFMNGAIYWTLREFAVNPYWTGGATLPAGDPPSGIHHKGLISYDGAVKPAFSVAQQLFGQAPPFVSAAAAAAGDLPRQARSRAPLALCASQWCADGPGGRLPTG